MLNWKQLFELKYKESDLLLNFIFLMVDFFHISGYSVFIPAGNTETAFKGILTDKALVTKSPLNTSSEESNCEYYLSKLSLALAGVAPLVGCHPVELLYGMNCY